MAFLADPEEPKIGRFSRFFYSVGSERWEGDFVFPEELESIGYIDPQIDEQVFDVKSLLRLSFTASTSFYSPFYRVEIERQQGRYYFIKISCSFLGSLDTQEAEDGIIDMAVVLYRSRLFK